MVQKSVRRSNFELLRLFCIFGIIYMHSFGDMLENVQGGNLVVAVFENALFNTGVSCFVLISGYFGLKFDISRLIKLDFVIIFYSVLGTVCQSLNGVEVGLLDWIRAFFPVISRRYWFMSCYFCLVIFASYLNLIVEKMEKKELEKFLLICLSIFSIIPTIFFIADNIMSDAGKGLANMILMYLIGRFLRVYEDKEHSRNKLLLLAGGSVFITFSLNMLLSAIRGVWTNNFSRDCSITIIISSIFIFLLFKEIKIQSSFINFLAQNVLAVYVFEGTVRNVINHYFDLIKYINYWYLFVLIAIYALVVMAVCISVNIIRQLTIGRIELLFLRFMEHWMDWGKSRLKLCLERIHPDT